LKTFKLPNDLRNELFAAEPQIESPLAMAFDEESVSWPPREFIPAQV
jgi:hypothetical protein